LKNAHRDKKRTNIKFVMITLYEIIFIVLSVYLGLNHYETFHVAAEVFSSFIAFSIFIIAVNTYEITKSIPFYFLGAAFGTAAGFNVIHIVASNGMGFFQGHQTAPK
jgi:hypothetical protein